MSPSEYGSGGRGAPGVQRPSNRRFYGWWIVGIGALTLAVTIGPVFHSVGTFFVALERQFQWSRTLLSGAFALSRAEGAIGDPLGGFLTDRIGIRKTLLLGFGLLGVGFLFLSRVSNPATLYIAYLIIAAGAGLAGFLPIMTTVNNWFIRRRAMALGIAMTGTSLAGLLVPATAWSINTYGWRMTAAGIGVFLWLVALPVIRAMRNRPEAYGMTPDGDPPAAVPAPSSPVPGPSRWVTAAATPDTQDFTARQALRTSAFWGISFAHAAAAICITTVFVHLVPRLTDMGLSPVLASVMLSVSTSVMFIFQLVGGWLGDRWDKRYIIFFFMSIQASALLVLAVAQNLPMALLFAVLFGIGTGGRGPPIMAIRGDYFGRKAYGTITGLSMLPMNLGVVVAPLMTGLAYDVQGTYTVAFLSLAVVALLGGLSILFARRPTQFPNETA